MPVTVRPLAAGDLRIAADLWNGRMAFDPVTPDRLASVSLGDPIVDPEGAVVAVNSTGLIALGVVSVRPNPAPDDRDADAAHLKVLVFADGREEALDLILSRLAAVAKRLGRKRFVIRGGGRYLMPAIDMRYDWLIGALKRRGFTDLEMLQDAEVDLGSWTPNERQRGIEAKLRAEGIQAVPFVPDLLPALREFAPNCGEPDWFPHGWEDAWLRAGRAIVAVQRGKILSYAEYSPGHERGWFGPTATLPDLRDRGIGTLVLTRTMQALKEAGTPLATASWVWPPEFYLKSGWRIARRYAALELRF